MADSDAVHTTASSADTEMTEVADPTPATGAGVQDAPTQRAPTPAEGGKPGKTRRVVIEWAILIGSALLIALLIKTFLFQAFYIPSESMEPTLNVGDRVLVNKLSYKMHAVHRGDIVVFTTPPAAHDDGNIKDLVKRVIALPGETIETRSGHVFINGRLLNEPYVMKGAITCLNANAPPSGCQDYPPRKIPRGDIFVMGDNRTASKDGRSFGPIKESSVVGRVFVRIWPLNHLGFL